MGKQSSTIIALVMTLAVVLTVACCGLENVVYLNSPESIGFSSTGKTFTLRKTQDNSEPEFRGFEFYYKFYDDPLQVEANINARDDLLSKKFKRLSSASERKDTLSRPLFPIPIGDRKGTEFDIIVSFLDLSNPSVTADDSALSAPITVNLRRAVVYTSGPNVDYFKGFQLSDFADTDADVTPGVYDAITTSKPVHLALYALSYGKRELIYDIYSVTVYLGVIEIRY